MDVDDGMRMVGCECGWWDVNVDGSMFMCMMGCGCECWDADVYVDVDIDGGMWML